MTSPTQPGSRTRRLAFDAPTFEAWLQSFRQELELGLGHGWLLSDVHAFGPWEIAVRLVHPERRLAPKLKVRLRNDALPAAARTEQLDILHRAAADDWDHDEKARMASVLADILLSQETTVEFVGVRPMATLKPAEDGPPPAFNLAVPGECKQDCGFCGVREELKVSNTPADGFVETLLADIERSAAQGTKVLRVNGIEPLAAPYIWDLLAHARKVGFEEFHVLSTFRPMADPEVARRLLDAMPARYRLYIPLYGSRAEVHDAVTKARGSFAETMAAMQQLRALMVERGELDRRGQLLVTTVLMRDNAADMHAMALLVRPLARTWEIHLPFPNTGSARDPYFEVATTMTGALEALAPAGFWPAGEIALGEVLPCVALRHQERTGHALVTADTVERRNRELAGTFYETVGFTHSLSGGREVAFTAATVPCPHTESCAAASICPQKVYAAYAQRHGIDELKPISALNF